LVYFQFYLSMQVICTFIYIQYPSGINWQWIAGLFWGCCNVYLVCQISFITYSKWYLSSMVYVVYWGFEVVFVLYVRFCIILVFLIIYVIYAWNFVYSMYWFNVQHQFTYIFVYFHYVCSYVWIKSLTRDVECTKDYKFGLNNWFKYG
jgi:hypothetical protein